MADYAIPGREHSPSSLTGLRDAIDAALSGPRHRLHMALALEQRYEAAVGATRGRQLCRGFLLMAAIHAFCTFIDLLVIQRSLMPVLALRWGLCIPLCLLGAWLSTREAPRSLRQAAIIAPFIGQAAGIVLIGGYASEPYTDRYFMAAGMGIVLVNVLFSLQFWQAVAQTALSVAAYSAALVAVARTMPNSSVTDFVLFAGLVAAGSLVSVHRVEVRNKRIFLLRTRDELRTRELQEANERLQILSLRDALTGVGNRRSFDLAIARGWSAAAESKTEIGLLMIDADAFKAYNDTLGHAEGDRCLRAIAQTLQCNLRNADDQVARYGGEEFVVLLANADAGITQSIAERMRKAVEQLRIPHPRSPSGAVVTISVGAATMKPSFTDAGFEFFVQAADEALYEAKHSGRNRVTVSALNRSGSSQRNATVTF